MAPDIDENQRRVSMGHFKLVSASGSMTTTAKSAIRNRESRSSGKGYITPDALRNLHPSKFSPGNVNATTLIRQIALSLVLLNAWTIDTIKQGCHSNLELVKPEESKELWMNLDPEVKRLIDMRAPRKLYIATFEDDIMDYLDQLDDSQLLNILHESQASGLYAQMMNLRSIFCRLAKDDLKALEDPTVHYPKTHALSHFETRNDCIAHLVFQTGEERHRLHTVIQESQTLRNRIAEAYEHHALQRSDRITSRRLKRKMEALQENFRMAYHNVHNFKSKDDLVYPSQPDWWKGKGRHEDQNNGSVMNEAPPADVVDVNVVSANNTSCSTLIFLVPSTCLLCCIPVVIAWNRTSSSPGTTNDANFFQQLSIPSCKYSVLERFFGRQSSTLVSQKQPGSGHGFLRLQAPAAHLQLCQFTHVSRLVGVALFRSLPAQHRH
ncbi:hypothetical protein K491DRAFT_778048 [Lophiostoma macrostomum CBS 122681]|uniref:Uncharacterized protein n=1 Tax=Lophiostoma macrostomum CBS 122681 TaxID=1314788 RepID=A0A6A6TCM0_9PLEO|nr:hypothetical protein K491DRAFT_778048 [Lophiostoma macrostomum CBS 122681]